MWQLARVLIASFSLLLVFAVNSSVMAQSSGSNAASVSGLVTDEQGAVIGGASVTVTNLDTNTVRETASGENGIYVVPQLPPGNYEIKVVAEGFQGKSLKLTLQLGTTSRVDFSLGLGQASEILEVQAGAVVLEEGKTESSSNNDRGRIDNLPINRRNFLDFSLTSARVVTDRIPQQGVTVTSGLSFNGQSSRFNNFTIDGLDNNDVGSGSVRATFSQEAVQEFQVVSDSYSAEFGRALGGVVNIVTRGGGNEFHGTLFNFVRNDELSARNAFTAIDPEFKQYQFGGTLSGPIKKDRAFFFTAFERLTLKQNNIITITDSTVAAIRRQGFAIDNGPRPFSQGNTSALARGDFKLTPSDTLFVRYNGGFVYNGSFENFGGLIADTNGGLQRLEDNSLAVSNTYVNTNINLINETRFLYGRRTQDLIPFGAGPQVRVNAPEGQVIFGRSTFLPQTDREADIYQIINNVTLTRGRQTIKFGIDYNHQRGSANLPSFDAGFTTFTDLNFSALTGIPGLPSFTALQALDPSLRTPVQLAFLTVLAAQLPRTAPGFPSGVPLARLSLPQAFIQGFGSSRLFIDGDFFSAFVQDDIRVKQNLIVKLGARFDRNNYKFMPRQDGNIAPRVAIAYRPGFLPKMNLRASYGIFFNAPITGIPFATELFRSKRVQLLVLPFPFSILPFATPGRNFPTMESLPRGVPVLPQLSQVLDFQPDLRASYTNQVSTGFDYLLGNNNVISVTYDYVRGIKVLANRNINPIVRPQASPLTSALVGRVDPTRGNVNQYQSAFDTYYNGITFSFNRRFSNNIGLLAHYTFSKAIDNFIDIRTDLFEAVNSLRPRDERGLSVQDVRSRFVLSGVWDLNYTKNPILTGFQVSSILSLNSGRPYNLLAGVDLNRNGDNPPGDRPLIGGTPIGRNSGILPGFANLDLRVTRTIKIGEKMKLQGFAEFFNVFNRVNISEVARIFPPDAMGRFNLPERDDDGRFKVSEDRFRGAFSPRQVQLGFRLSF